VEGDTDSIATALRRFAADLSSTASTERDVTVRMRSGVGLAGVDVEGDTTAATANDAETLLAVDDATIVTVDGSLTAIVVDGEVDSAALAAVVERLAAENVVVDAAGVAGEKLVVVVPRRDGANALRLVESALELVPA
jgi:hypothetical protein